MAEAPKKVKAAAHEAAVPVAVKAAPVKVATATVAAKPLAPAPKVAGKAPVAPAPKVEQAIDRKVVDPTPTASLPPAAAAPTAAPCGGGRRRGWARVPLAGARPDHPGLQGWSRW